MQVEFVGRIKNQDGQEQVENQVGIDVGYRIDGTVQFRHRLEHSGAVQYADKDSDGEQSDGVGKSAVLEQGFQDSPDNESSDGQQQRGKKGVFFHSLLSNKK